MRRLRDLHRTIGRFVSDWFTAPETNAAGRMGLFRILYCLFYLWHLSFHFAWQLSHFPANYWGPMLVVHWIPRDLPPLFFQGLESLLVTALLLLLVGWQTRAMTFIVLLAGGLLEALYVSLVGDHSMVFLGFYVPFFMFLNGRWGHTYSLDAWLHRRHGQIPVDPANSSWPYFLPARCMLVILFVLFTSAGLLKVFAGGTWLQRPDLLATILLEKNVKCAVLGLPLNPVAPFIYEHETLRSVLRFATIALESSFAVALLSRRLCKAYLLFALLFHATNALWLIVTFTPVLVVYLQFVDWQYYVERMSFRVPRIVAHLPTPAIICPVIVMAIAAGVAWHFGTTLRDILNWGGVLNWRTIWYPVLPLAGYFLVRELHELVRAVIRGGPLQRLAFPIGSPVAPGETRGLSS